MSDWFPITDGLSGVQTFGSLDTKGNLTTNTVQDVEPILQANKKAYDPDNKYWRGDGFHHVASIPLVALEHYCKTQGLYSKDADGNEYVDFNLLFNDEKRMKQILNDPENRFFRTKPGKL